MYGTVARLQVKPGQAETLQRLAESDERQPDGLVAAYALQTDANPNEVYLVSIFKSEEAYRANAQSPEQHESFLKIVELLEGEPEWHDGQIVFATNHND